MGNYTNFGGFENLRRGRQARNLKTNVPKILDLKSSSEQIFSKNCRWVPLNDYCKQNTLILTFLNILPSVYKFVENLSYCFYNFLFVKKRVIHSSDRSP